MTSIKDLICHLQVTIKQQSLGLKNEAINCNSMSAHLRLTPKVTQSPQTSMLKCLILWQFCSHPGKHKGFIVLPLLHWAFLKYQILELVTSVGNITKNDGNQNTRIKVSKCRVQNQLLTSHFVKYPTFSLFFFTFCHIQNQTEYQHC